MIFRMRNFSVTFRSLPTQRCIKTIPVGQERRYGGAFESKLVQSMCLRDLPFAFLECGSAHSLSFVRSKRHSPLRCCRGTRSVHRGLCEWCGPRLSGSFRRDTHPRRRSALHRALSVPSLWSWCDCPRVEMGVVHSCDDQCDPCAWRRCFDK